MAGYVELERQNTPYKLTALKNNDEIPLKANIVLRAVEVEHTVPAMGFVAVEKRSKLKEELLGMPQEKLRELKERGQEITKQLQIPLVAYMGDTAPGPHLIEARAIDKAGEIQPEEPAAPAPDGAQGYHRIRLHVTAP